MVRRSHPAALFALAATAAVASSLVMVPPPPRRLHRFARSRSPVVTLAAAPAADEADVDLEEVMVFANEGTIECKTCRDKYYFPKTQEELEDEAAAAATVAAEDGPDLMDMLAPEPPPHAIDEERLPGVYHLGLHQTSTIGVSPYLIVRPEGNVMVDVPAWSRPLAERLDELGGADYLILTSGEMTEGHEAWKEWYPDLVRVLHEFDMRSDLKPQKLEQVLQGSGPWQVGGSGGDGTLRLLHTPGRTFGSICARYAPRTEKGGTEAAIFTGGLVGYNMRLGKLDGYSAFNRGGIERQASSMRALADAGTCGGEWQWMLPAMGRGVRYESHEDAKEKLLATGLDFAGSQRKLKWLCGCGRAF